MLTALRQPWCYKAADKTRGNNVSTQQIRYSWPTRLVHLGLAVFGISAYFTADAAHGASDSPGYLWHAYLGLAVSAFVLIRLARGFAGPGSMRFGSWAPWSRGQLAMALDDLKMLFRLKLPERSFHAGFAGLAQFFGLLLFAWMSATGIVMYFVDGATGGELFEIAEEMHEIGEYLVPIYLILHVGGVVLHALNGTHLWRRMFGVGRTQ